MKIFVKINCNLVNILYLGQILIIFNVFRCVLKVFTRANRLLFQPVATGFVTMVMLFESPITVTGGPVVIGHS